MQVIHPYIPAEECWVLFFGGNLILFKVLVILKMGVGCGENLKGDLAA